MTLNRLSCPVKFIVSLFLLFGVTSTVFSGEVVGIYMAFPDVVVFHFRERNIALNATIIEELNDAATFSVRSADDGTYSTARQPQEIGHKRKVHSNAAWSGDPAYQNSIEVWASLKLPSALTPGKQYTVSVTKSTIAYVIGIAETTFVFDDKTMISNAIHVNTVGMATWAGMKFGYVSHWLGTLGQMVYNNGTPFGLVNAQSGETVFSGTINERGGGGTSIYKQRIWEADFSSFSTPGHYRLFVQGIGCSHPFEIHKDGYRTAFHSVARGMFHQRSGNEFREENTFWHMEDVPTKRAHHSDDVPTWQTNLTFPDGHDDPAAFHGTWTERVDATGGWYDAGDWDHYPSHQKVPFMLVAAYELNPGAFEDGELNINESGDGIPDILNEAFWGMEVWWNLQKSNGMVPDYVIPDPNGSNPFTTDNIWVSTTSTNSAGMFAAMAACKAYYYKKFNKNDKYQEALEKAIRSYGVGSGDGKALAALWLWRTTRDESYHTAFKNSGVNMTDFSHDGLAAYIGVCYMTAQGADQGIVNNIRTHAVNNANSLIGHIDGNPMRTYIQHDFLGAITTPRSISLPVAYKLTGESRYRNYHALVCDYFLGGNTLNMTWVSGLGAKSPTDLLHCMFHRYHAPLGRPVPEGIIPYGPASTHYGNQEWCSGVIADHRSCFPATDQWSLTELWFEKPGTICTNEWTIHQTQGPALFAYAALVDNDVSRRVTGGSAWPIKVSDNTPTIQPALSAAPVAHTGYHVLLCGGMVRVESSRPTQIAVHTAAGRLVLARKAALVHEFDRRGLPAGICVLTVRDDQNSVSRVVRVHSVH